MANVTAADIISGLRDLGVRPGDVLLVHSSLSHFGFVEGGADTVIDALLQVISPGGTVMVPTLTGHESLSPENPPLFNPAETPCWTGRIPETFRQRPNAIRSLHPTHSVAAIGTDAVVLTRDHHLSISPCDDLSPYGKLARMERGFILLLGVDHETNTTFHHIEETAAVDYQLQRRFTRAVILLEGREIYQHLLLHFYGPARNFSVMEPIFLERGIQRNTRIGKADIRLIHSRRMVETTLRALRGNPRILLRETG